jgi:hypothetical protein
VLSLLTRIRFAPGQARVLPIRITQSKAFEGDAISFDVHLTSGGSSETLSVRIPITQLGHWSETGGPVAVKASYFSADMAPFEFIALPPADPNAPVKTPRPPILALRSYIYKCNVAYLLRNFCEVRWRRCRYLEKPFLGRSCASSKTELGDLSLWKDSLGKSSYTVVYSLV